MMELKSSFTLYGHANFHILASVEGRL